MSNEVKPLLEKRETRVDIKQNRLECFLASDVLFAVKTFQEFLDNEINMLREMRAKWGWDELPASSKQMLADYEDMEKMFVEVFGVIEK